MKVSYPKIKWTAHDVSLVMQGRLSEIINSNKYPSLTRYYWQEVLKDLPMPWRKPTKNQ